MIPCRVLSVEGVSLMFLPAVDWNEFSSFLAFFVGLNEDLFRSQLVWFV
jgi:hypothetical protein